MGMAAEPQFHVLAVDDSSIDRKLIERLLKTSSYQVTTVDSGSKALEFLGLQEEDEHHQNQPSVCPDSQQVSLSPRKKEVEVNLIITDYCMPGMTGYDLLKKVKESTTFRNIPVVVMSSENVPSRINRCLEEGAEEFFLKPVQLSDVNRLRPHMLRAKYGQQRQDLLHECQKPEPKPEQQYRQQHFEQPEPKPEQQPPCEQPPEPKPKQQQQLCQRQHEQVLEHQTEQHHQQYQQRYEQDVSECQTEQQQQCQTEQQQQQQQCQQCQTEQQQQQQCQQQYEQALEHRTEQQQTNNKRKSMDEGLSQDRTRPRYNGITTMV